MSSPPSQNSEPLLVAIVGIDLILLGSQLIFFALLDTDDVTTHLHTPELPRVHVPNQAKVVVEERGTLSLRGTPLEPPVFPC